MESAREIFLNSVKKICPEITDYELEVYNSKVTTTELNKKDIFLHSNKVQESIGYIIEGLVRSFYIDQEGNEITVGFYAAGEYATHYHAFLKRQPSHYTIQCLEPTKLICLSFENLQFLYKHSPTFEKYGRLIAEKVLISQQSRIEGFIFQTAEERYIDFISNHPDLFNRISISHLCSFLGIERQTLTRIRHKLAYQ